MDNYQYHMEFLKTYARVSWKIREGHLYIWTWGPANIGFKQGTFR